MAVRARTSTSTCRSLYSRVRKASAWGQHQEHERSGRRPPASSVCYTHAAHPQGAPHRPCGVLLQRGPGGGRQCRQLGRRGPAVLQQPSQMTGCMFSLRCTSKSCGCYAGRLLSPLAVTAWTTSEDRETRLPQLSTTSCDPADIGSEGAHRIRGASLSIVSVIVVADCRPQDGIQALFEHCPPVGKWQRAGVGASLWKVVTDGNIRDTPV